MPSTSLKGGQLLQKRLAELAAKVAKGATLRVGFLEGATYPDGTSVATVAAINNFGAPAKGIPARPFFSNMVASNSPTWGAKLAKLLELNDWDAYKALDMMGAGIAGELRQSIVATSSPPNSMATNLLKQRFPMGGYEFDDVLKAWSDATAGETAPPGKPLTWTGHMLNSVDHEVEE